MFKKDPPSLASSINQYLLNFQDAQELRPRSLQRRLALFICQVDIRSYGEQPLDKFLAVIVSCETEHRITPVTSVPTVDISVSLHQGFAKIDIPIDGCKLQRILVFYRIFQLRVCASRKKYFCNSKVTPGGGGIT